MDGDNPRLVLFTDASKDDLIWMRVTRDEWAIIKAEIKRIAGVKHVTADSAVCRIACTGGDWLRLKLRDPNVRIAFTVEENDTRLVIRAIVRRVDNTYDMIEILYNVAV